VVRTKKEEKSVINKLDAGDTKSKNPLKNNSNLRMRDLGLTLRSQACANIVTGSQVKALLQNNNIVVLDVVRFADQSSTGAC